MTDDEFWRMTLGGAMFGAVGAIRSLVKSLRERRNREGRKPSIKELRKGFRVVRPLGEERRR